MEYLWYELIKDSDEISQGDILYHCPVPFLNSSLDITSGAIIEAEMKYIDGIIMTQACDLANGKVQNVVLCTVDNVSNFKLQMQNQNKNAKEIQNQVKHIINGNQPAFHIINMYESKELKQEHLLISFKDLFSIPVSVAKQVAKTNKNRLRLCPRYREHLSQAFARYFMRVGLPNNIQDL